MTVDRPTLLSILLSAGAPADLLRRYVTCNKALYDLTQISWCTAQGRIQYCPDCKTLRQTSIAGCACGSCRVCSYRWYCYQGWMEPEPISFSTLPPLINPLSLAVMNSLPTNEDSPGTH